MKPSETGDPLALMMQDNFIRYASHVILERAIPDALDGLKPVQRRLLYTLHLMDDGRYHKVMNVVGQTMALHPHGDAPIYEALVNLANKGLLLARQGNFGNPHTGDPAAAGRYIETRLLPLARDTLFSSELSHLTPSYDGRRQEPTRLPAKIPLLLMLGAEGIAVGMSTRIFPHRFEEVIEAEIAYLKGESFCLLPDFPSGGVMDASLYNEGRGRIILRASLELIDEKTLRIREIPYSTTTESVITSIEAAAREGKLKIEEIHDYTAEHVDIEIKTPRGYSSRQLQEALFAFTLCEVSLQGLPVVLYQDMPCDTTTKELLCWHSVYLQHLIEQDLIGERIELENLLWKSSLERVFIENKLYRELEEVDRETNLTLKVLELLSGYQSQLSHQPSPEDAAYLLALPLRRLSRFDLATNATNAKATRQKLEVIQARLNDLKGCAIGFLEDLLSRYQKPGARRTRVMEFESSDARAADQRRVKVSIDVEKRLIGTRVNANLTLEMRPDDRLLIFFKEGIVQIIKIKEKHLLTQGTIEKVVSYDKEQVWLVVYRKVDLEGLWWAKRFAAPKTRAGRPLSFLSKNEQLVLLIPAHQGRLRIEESPRDRRKKNKLYFLDLEKVPLSDPSSPGVALSHEENVNVSLVEDQK